MDDEIRAAQEERKRLLEEKAALASAKVWRACGPPKPGRGGAGVRPSGAVPHGHPGGCDGAHPPAAAPAFLYPVPCVCPPP
jgi:hypothetical protein